MFYLEEQLQLELVKDTFILIQWKSNWLGSLLASDQSLGVSWTKSASVRFFCPLLNTMFKFIAQVNAPFRT